MGGYPETGQYPASGTGQVVGVPTGEYPGNPPAGPATGTQPPAPPTGQFRPTGEYQPTGQLEPTGEYRPTGVQPPTGQFEPTGEYAKFKAGQAAAAKATSTGASPGTSVAGRAARARGKQHANRRLRVAAGVILAATLMVGGGAWAAQGRGSQPFAGLLAGDRETTTTSSASSPAVAGTPQPAAAPTTQPPTTAAPTTTAPPATTKPPATQEAAPEPAAAASAGNRAGPGVKPNADNTGVPAGVKLRAHSGDLDIDESGTTISGLDIDGCVWIDADDVTIRNSRIRCDGSYAVRLSDAASGVLLEDVEIDGGGNSKAIAVADDNYTVRRADIHNIGDGPRLGDNTRVEYSFIHDLVEGGGSHNDGVQSTGGSNIVVRGNVIDNQNSQTSAVLIGADLGAINGAVVEGNWLNGGGYTVLAGGDSYDYAGIRIVNNTFGRDHAHGPMDIEEGVVWEGNEYADGEAIPR